MNIKQAIRELAVNKSDEAIKVVAQAIAENSRRGEYQNGPGSTDVNEWIIDGSFQGDETLAQLIAEWDEEK